MKLPKITEGELEFKVLDNGVTQVCLWRADGEIYTLGQLYSSKFNDLFKASPDMLKALVKAYTVVLEHDELFRISGVAGEIKEALQSAGVEFEDEKYLKPCEIRLELPKTIGLFQYLDNDGNIIQEFSTEDPNVMENMRKFEKNRAKSSGDFRDPGNYESQDEYFGRK